LNKVNLPDDFVTYATSGDTYDIWNITYETDVPAVDGRGGNKHDEVTITLVGKTTTLNTMMGYFTTWVEQFKTSFDINTF
ncbi:MAG: hypothetical protein U9Q40_03125, partial [Campylobacterota bacterium]|nr:hypothetical protein [Campylobacterota bacterium]